MIRSRSDSACPLLGISTDARNVGSSRTIKDVRSSASLSLEIVLCGISGFCQLVWCIPNILYEAEGTPVDNVAVYGCPELLLLWENFIKTIEFLMRIFRFSMCLFSHHQSTFIQIVSSARKYSHNAAAGPASREVLPVASSRITCAAVRNYTEAA